MVVEVRVFGSEAGSVCLTPAKRVILLLAEDRAPLVPIKW
jgi:hypothetical protein